MFNIPDWMAFTASWLGLIGGVWSIFDRAEIVASDHTKLSVSRWLKRIKVPISWRASFLEIFTRVFGENHFSWRCFRMSAIISFSLSMIILVLWFAMTPEESLKDFSFRHVLILPIVVSLLNVFPDYLSLLETRIALRLLARTAALPFILLIILIDLVLSTLIFLSAVAVVKVATPFIGDATTLLDMFLRGLTFEKGEFDVIPFAPFLYTTYATSAWLWLFAFSGFLIRFLVSTTRLLSLLDIDNKPIRSLGFISMILVSVAYLFIPICMVFAS